MRVGERLSNVNQHVFGQVFKGDRERGGKTELHAAKFSVENARKEIQLI